MKEKQIKSKERAASGEWRSARVDCVTWDCSTFTTEEHEKRNESREGGRVSGRRDFLYEGRLGTSERQGNHDNQTTNPGNQLGVLTVIGRLSARQGLIWAENREEETTAASPINLLYVLYRAKENNNNNKLYFQNTIHVLEATVSHRCNNFSSGQEKNCISETMKL